MIKTLATFGGSDPLRVLLGDAETGWSGAFGMDRLTWNPTGNLVVTPMEWANYQYRQTGFQGYVDGRFAFGSAQPGGWIWAGEADAFNVLRTVDDSIGDTASRYAGYTPFGKGMFAVINVDPAGVRPVPQPSYIYDMLLREPGRPWYCARAAFPSKFGLDNVASSYRDVHCAVDSNGKIQVYGEGDSSGEIVNMEVSVIPDEQGRGTLSPGNHKEAWIPRDPSHEDPLSPCGEWAMMTVTPDPMNGRILLVYQQSKDIILGTSAHPLIYGRWTVVEHRPGLPPKSLGMVDRWCLHKAGQRVIVVPMADNAVYLGLPYDNIHSDGAKGWWFSTLKDGVFTPSKDALPYGDVMSTSFDGAAVFFDRSNYSKQMIQVIPA